MAPSDPKDLAHQLAVHQAELEAQNEALREAQASLQRVHERFVALFEEAPVGYVTLDASGIIRQANATCLAMFGCSGEDLNGTPFADRLEPVDASVFRARFRALFRNPVQKQIVASARHRDGTSFPVRIEARPRPWIKEHETDESRAELLVVISDISELVASQQRTERLNSVLSAIRNVNQLITKEDDRTRLIRGACDCLTENLSYRNPWIALLDGNGKTTVLTTGTSPAPGMERLSVRLAEGEPPQCTRRALAQDGVVVVRDPVRECTDCPLSSEYCGRTGFVRRLAFGGRTYGVLAGSVPEACADDAEELELFDELAGDIAFALHKIEAAELSRREQERMRLVIDGACLGTWEWNVQTHETVFNEIWATMLGYTLEELGTTSIETWSALTHPDDLKKAEALLAPCLAGETRDYTCELRMKHKDGRWVWILDRGRVITHDAQGRPLLMFGIHVDITETKQAEEDVRRNLERLTAVVDILQHESRGVQEFLDFSLDKAIELSGSRIGYIYFYDEERRQFTLNSWSKDVMRECTVTDPQTCYELDATGIWGEAVRQRGPIVINDFEADNPLKKGYPSGHVHLARFLTVPVLSYGRIVAVAGVANKDTDYTERDVLELTLLMDAVWKSAEALRTEQALRESEARFRSYVENAPYGVFVVDGQGQYLDVNPAATRITGYSRSELLSMSIPDLLPPEGREVGLAHFQRVCEAGEAYGEAAFRRADDRTGYWSVSAICLGPERYLAFVEDTTERRQREERVALLGQMLDEAPASITVHDTAGRFLFANRQTLRRHGYDSEEEFLAVNLHDLDVPESEALLAERFRRIAEEGEARFEVSHYRKDGTTFPLEVMAKRIVWDGRPAVLSVASDITERKAAEEELRESEARFRTLIEHAPASVLLLRDGHYVYGNPAATVLLGLERPEDVVGLDALATIAPEYREAVRMRMANAASGKSNAMMEMELIRSDGRRLWVLSTSVTLTMQGLPTTLIMGQDATGVREAQRALRESEERFRNLFENLAAGSCLDELIYEHGKVVDYRILDVNPYYERIMGIPRERARNALGSELYGLSEAPFLEDLARVAETGEPARFDAFFEPIGRHLDFTVFCPEPGLFATVFTDVTDRIQIERALQQSQARHERAQQVAHIGHWDLESPAAVPVWSDEVFNILGLEPGTHEPSFPEHEDLVHPEDWPVLRNAVRNGFRDGSSFDLVLRILRPGTEFGWLHIIGEPRRDDHGNVVGMFGTAQDLTALKHAEERLRRSEARNRLLSDVTMEGILIHREGVAVDVNASMARMLGFEREELAGTDFFQFVHPDDQPRVKAKMAEDYAAPYVIRARRRDGSSFPAEVESRDFVAEDGVWRVSAVRDVTDRLAAERALRESEERFSKAFRTSPYAVMITRASDGWILEVNDAFTTITGHSREEAVHSSTLELALWSDPAERADVIAALRQGRSVTNREYLFRHRDGSPIACLFSAQSLNLQGEACVLSSINDVTEQRKDREERDRLQQELIQAQKMEAIGTLAGGIAHDFNNILAAIMGYAELLDAWVGQGDRKIHHAVAEILRATRRARDLVTQILSFSRRQAADIHSIGVSPLVKEAVKMLRSVLPSTVRVEVRAMSGGDTVMADPAQIHQVLMNLATNGWQAMRETGGTLTIEVSLTEDDSAAGAACSELPPGPYVRMTVSDTGPGIPEELLPRIFEPFFTTKGTNEGTGLGLSVVHGIVKRHGGGVAVHSAPGNGATFEVYLPLAKQRAEEPQAEDEAALPRGCERILLVDDEESLLEVMATLLLGLGYHVTTRRNGKDAVELLEARPNGFDLVVTDLTMPQMTGLDVVHALGERAMDLPVILCTGYSERLTPERAAEEGLSAILNKPISNSELAHAVRTALDEHTG